MKTITSELRDKLHTLLTISQPDSLAGEVAQELLQEENEIPVMLGIIDSNNIMLTDNEYQSGDRATLEAQVRELNRQHGGDEFRIELLYLRLPVLNESDSLH